MTKKLKIRDLTLRDGQQSLFATRLSQQSIDKLLPYYLEAGFYAMEVWGGAVPDSVMRYLDESPWVRLKSISDKIQGKSYLTALSRGRNLFGYVPYPTSVIEGFYKEAIANGLGIMRIFDALNDLDNVKESVEIINKLGGIPDGAVCYTVDPKDEPVEVEIEVEEEVPAKGFFAKLMGKKEIVKTVKKVKQEPEKIFTDDYFVEKAKGYEKLGAKIITLKDMAGLVNPARIATLMPRLKAAVNVPIDFHTHCTPGYGLASGLMAILHDVDILDTNIWWFGEGSAAPAIELIYVFAKKLGVEVEVNMEAVGKIREELKGIREGLKDFDLHKDNFPKPFDPLKDELPAEIDAQFDKAIEAAKANDEAALLAACHAIEEYFNFPKPNLIVKEAEVPGGMYSNMVAQLRQLKAEDVLEDAMKLIPKVRRDAGLVPLVTPTSQIVGSQAVMVALSRKAGNEDYKNVSNQFSSLVRGEYGKTPVAIDPAFRKQITGSEQEVPYDVNSYKSPENPVLAKYGNVKLAKDNQEYLLLELLPTVAKTFLENRRAEEFEAAGGSAAAAPVEEKPAAVSADGPVTGPTLNAPMGGTVVEIHVKPGDKVKKGQSLLMYEAMKMQNEIESEGDYTVKRILVKQGDVVQTGQPIIEFEDPNGAAAEDGPVTGPTLNAPMGGTVIELHVKPGDKVKKGQSLLMYEAMKMQNEIESEGDYTVKRILVKEGEVIAAGQPIIEFM
ncbi:MAG: biotin/lipoyl-containing protein [Muribaculaceae bacterium]|nr:biotin/lipoyl-containing protein [Muribaculaceae bacterium]